MNRLSVSKMSTAYQCLYGFREDVLVYPRPPGRPAQRGSVVHSLVEQNVNGVVAECEDDSLMAEAKAIYDGPLSGFVASRKWTSCEQGFRYDSVNDTCESGPRRGEPGYDDVPTHVLHGTADLIEVVGDEAFVVDVKTGKPPEDAFQLYGQAVFVSRKYGVSKVRVAYARALKTKLDLLHEEELDADRLDAEAGRIAKALRMLPVAQPNPGSWCWFCEARPGCPAHERSDDYVPPDAPAAEQYEEGRRLL